MSADGEAASTGGHDGPASQPVQGRGNLEESVRNDLAQQEQEEQERAEEISARFGETLKSPTGGAVVAGTVVLGAAVLWGAAETALGAGAAYGAYWLIRKLRPSHER